MGTAVTVQELCKRYGSTVAVADVSFEVAEGEIFGLLGPNGSGKTTTVECLQGLRRPDAGTLAVFGHDPRTRTAQVRHLVGSQLQDSALPDRIKVWEALSVFAALGPGGPPWQQLLDEWGLAGHRRTAFGDLSGGQRQRLFIALALVNEPRLVILDEMTTGLDPAARRVAWGLVEEVRRRGTTVLLVTHFMDEAQRLCDRIAVLVHGRVVAHGTPDEIVRAQHPSRAVSFTAHRHADLTFLDQVRGVQAVAREASGPVRVTGTGPLLARVAHALVEHEIEPEDLVAHLPTLEDAYLALTAETAPETGAV